MQPMTDWDDTRDGAERCYPAHLDTILPPEENPPGPPPNTYVSPELAFVYVETMPDLGSCPASDGADPKFNAEPKGYVDPTTAEQRPQ